MRAGGCGIAVLLGATCFGPRVAQAAPISPRLKPLTQRTYQVAAVGSRAYLATTLGLQIVDMRRPNQPKLLGALAVPGSAIGIAVARGIAYVAAGPHGVVLVDVKNPARPRQLSRIDTPGSATQVYFDQGRLFIADGSYGVAVYNVVDPRRPRKMGSLKIPGYARDVIVLGRKAYVAADRAGVVVISAWPVKNQPFPRFVARRALPGEARDLTVGQGRVLYVAAGSAGFHVLDPRNPRRMARLATRRVPDYAHGVSAWGTRLAVAAGDGGVRLFSCTRPNRPRATGHFLPKPERPGNKVLLRRGRLYVANDAGGLLMLSSGRKPALLGRYPTLRK